MKKILIGIFVGILIAIICFFALIQFSICEFIPNDHASVTVKNESGKNIKRIVLKHIHGQMEEIQLSNNEESRFIFSNSGENSYSILVTFDNDSTLTSKDVYFENGYRGTETIKKAEIITEKNW